MSDKIYPNLKSWKAGISGNPAGRKPGSKNISTIVGELLEQDAAIHILASDRIARLADGKETSYAKAVVIAMLLKALDGDVKAATWLTEQYSKNEPINEEMGLYHTTKLIVEVVK